MIWLICLFQIYFQQAALVETLTATLHVLAPVVTATFIILSSNKIQNGEVLVPVYPG